MRGPFAGQRAPLMLTRMNILSIQSWVSYGHVGNASAVFPLQRLGAEVWAINTVQFSNHPGYGAWTGQVYDGASVTALVEGIAARGVLPGCDAVLSGYMGDPGIVAAVLDAVRRVRAANPAALYCCDPVIGDTGPGIYVSPGIPALMREAAAEADILTPNQFELEYLTGATIRTEQDALAAARALRIRPGGTVLVTSVSTDQTPPGTIDMIAIGPGGAWRLRTPRLPIVPSGAGDAVAALFLFHMLRMQDPRASLEAAGSAVHGLLRRTASAGSHELLIVAAQDEFIRPRDLFQATPLDVSAISSRTA